MALQQYLTRNKHRRLQVSIGECNVMRALKVYVNSDELLFDAEQPGVISVFENKRIQMHTTRSWEFLGLEKEGGNIALDSLWKKANFGDGIIIGNIDSGSLCV